MPAPSFAATPTGSFGDDPNSPYWQQVLGPLLMEALAQHPVTGVNVHAEPQGKQPFQPWIQNQTIEPIPFGSLADPVSQLAFMLAPGLLQGGKNALEAAATPGPRVGSMFASERGNLGNPPIGWRGGKEVPLPESVARDPQGNLVKVYHGTRTTFPDFDVALANPQSLYGPGIYTTANPRIASGYSETVSGAAPQVRPTYLDVRRPFDIDRYVEPETTARFRDLIQTPGTGLSRMEERYARALEDAAHKVNWAKGNVHNEPPHPEYLPQAEDWHALVQSMTPQQYGVYNDATMKGLSHAKAATLAQQSPRGTVGPSIAEGDPVESARILMNWQRRPSGGQTVYEDLTALAGKRGTQSLLQQADFDAITHLGGMGRGQGHQVYIPFSQSQVYPSYGIDAWLQAQKSGELDQLRQAVLQALQRPMFGGAR